MKCWRCNAELEESSQFCTECGARQETSQNKKQMFCPNCGTELEEDSAFCSNCGARIEDDEILNDDIQAEDEVSGGYDDVSGDDVFEDEDDFLEDDGVLNEPENLKYATQNRHEQETFVAYKKKGGSLPLIIILLLVALLLVGGIVFGVKKLLFGGSTTTEVVQEVEELEEAAEADPDEVDLSEVDINAVGNSECTLEGKIKKTESGAYALNWSDGITIYGMDESDAKVLAEDVTYVYIDEENLQAGVVDSIAANEKVKVNGTIYFRGDTIYLKANKIIDENGKEISVEDEEEYDTQELSDEYVIAYSDQRLLDESDVADLSLREINYAKNEIYARHGRKFQSQELQEYFNSKSWYRGTIEPDDFSNSLLSGVEKKNVEFLSDIEFSMSPNGYQLDQ